ncbi:hypothetical protein C8J27_102238 [Rhodobacter aestuarii]|uniref:PRC-barrel domain-containing protein n=1 Tax=Rhodobacter aestuarii TaxID=453582 RepID=A0A1N7NFX3_9RHOB|nr:MULTISPECIES: hypothetical protein [Rhodobacter]PTV96444.1 hypothetical protein C8J27_102238 [Rhodobacter aestuarii]SIS97257.1 hypothetical protein SAMN05421580_107238 [Rhodobacter aestuarii]SOB92110.1 hypothetical protein SAMN05877809_101495 [Rhodobacter sp. JA431]
MKRMNSTLTSLLVAGIVAAPVAAFATSDNPYGLIDYKMGIATLPTAGSQGDVAPPLPDQYGIADVKTGTVKATDTSAATSNGLDNRPIQTLLVDQSGIALNKGQAQAAGAVVTADGGAVGTISRVVPGEQVDTVYVRASNDIKQRTFSMFKVNVPKGALKGDQLHLQMTMAELIAELNGQS